MPAPAPSTRRSAIASRFSAGGRATRARVAPRATPARGDRGSAPRARPRGCRQRPGARSRPSAGRPHGRGGQGAADARALRGLGRGCALSYRDMLLRVRSITYLAQRINGYELVDPDECDLPGFTAGAHVSVRVGHGPVRDFSLWNDPAEQMRYCIAVLREPEGQGSREWREQVRVGDIVEASAPRNNFPLAAEAEHHLLIAGGIGITPI